jgi:outer membrane immunogenic protein
MLCIELPQISSSLVAGAFFDFDFEEAGSELNINVPSAPFQASAKVNAENKWSIGGRLGYLATPGTFLFVSGGFTQLNIGNLNLAGGPFPNVTTAITVPNFSGAFVGAGAEAKFTEHISLRGEYRISDFGSAQLLGLPTVNGINLNDFARVSSSMQDGRVSLNYRF